jgi:hypothetical protein
MKKLLCGVSLFLAFHLSVLASYTVALPVGITAIANSLDNGANTADVLFPNPNGERDFDQIYKYDCATGFVVFTIDSGFPTGFGNAGDTAGVAAPTLAPGEGAFYENNQGVQESVTFNGTAHVPIFPPTNYCGCGSLTFLGCQTTNAGTYQNITGVLPQETAQVLTHNVGQGTYPLQAPNYTVYTYIGGVWTPSTPVLNLGTAAFFSIPCSNYTSGTNLQLFVWSGDGTLKKLAADGSMQLVTNNLSGGNGPVGLVFDNVGNLYAGCPNDSFIKKFSSNGISSLIGPNIDSVSGLAFDNNGKLLATIPNYGEVDQLDYQLGYGYWLNGQSTNHTSSHLNYPVNVVFDRAGNFYAASSVAPYNSNPQHYTNTIQKYSSSFIDLGTFATNINRPWGMAFDSSSNLFVSSVGSNIIYRIKPNGTRSTFATASSGLNNPCGLGFDQSGNLYVANSGSGTIEMFTPDGTGSIIVSGLTSPISIAIFPGLNNWSAAPVTLNHPKIQGGFFQFDFIENSGLAFTVLNSTDLASPSASWTTNGSATEVSPGQYQFADPQAATNPRNFYRVRSQ